VFFRTMHMSWILGHTPGNPRMSVANDSTSFLPDSGSIDHGPVDVPTPSVLVCPPASRKDPRGSSHGICWPERWSKAPELVKNALGDSR